MRSGELIGLEVWDGLAHRGRAAVRWSGRGADAVLEAVTPLEEGAAPGAGEGLCVLPGLVDTHVHLLGYAGGESVDFATWPVLTRPDEQVLHGLSHAQRALRGGVTTVRDMAADETQVSLRSAVDAGVVEGPRVLVNCMVGMTAGHHDLFTPRTAPDRHPTADGVDACRALVRRWARAGTDGIKICTSGGGLSSGDGPGWRNHTRAEVAAIVDEAHALGMRVAAHAHSAEGISVALDEGVDSLEHATLMTPELAERAAAAGVPVAPTLLINEVIAERRVPVSAETADKAAALVARRDGLLRAAAAAGVQFVLGTDANGFHVQFGDQMAELRRMAEVLGLSPEQVLRSGTSAAAAAVGRGDLGVLAQGARADLLVLRGRPWEHLEDLRVENVVAAVSRGRVVHGSLPGS